MQREAKKAVVILALSVLSACGGPPFPRYRPLARSARSPGHDTAYLRYCPQAVRIVERVTVRRGDRESTTSFCGLVFPPDALYLQGFGDWGGGNFALRRNARGVRGYNLPRDLPAGLLEDALLRGEARALLPPPPGSVLPVGLPTGEAAALARQGSEETILRRDGSATIIECGLDGQWVATVRIDAWFQGADGRPLCPRRIVVDGRRMEYKAWIEIVSWEDAGQSEDEFREAFDARFEHN